MTHRVLSCRTKLPFVEILDKLGTIVIGRSLITLSNESGSSSITPGRMNNLVKGLLSSHNLSFVDVDGRDFDFDDISSKLNFTYSHKISLTFIIANPAEEH